MNAGDRRERVSIEAKTGGVTSFGTIAETWTLVMSRWAKVGTVGARSGTRSGGEGNFEGTPTYSGSFRFIFAAPTAISLNHRIIWKGMPFDVQFVDISSPDLVIVTGSNGQQVGA